MNEAEVVRMRMMAGIGLWVTGFMRVHPRQEWLEITFADGSVLRIEQAESVVTIEKQTGDYVELEPRLRFVVGQEA